jgi:hypothetical protein
VAAEVGVAAESEAQSSADVDVAYICGSSRHSDGEILQLLLRLVYDSDGSHSSSTWLSRIGRLPAHSIIARFQKKVANLRKY